MNNIGTKITITAVLAVSIWQLDTLIQKFRPLLATDTVVQEEKSKEAEERTKQLIDYTIKDQSISQEDLPLQPDRISIAKINLELPVIAVPLENGTWEVKPNVANYAMGTSMISESGGNVGIYGHARDEVFADIKNLKTGDEIILYSNNRKAIYKVSKSSVVTPDAVDVFYPTDDPTLTLVTCDGNYSEKRYIVTAILVNKE